MSKKSEADLDVFLAFDARLKLETLLVRCLPLLVKLGDYQGNADDRCELILDIKRALRIIK